MRYGGIRRDSVEPGLKREIRTGGRKRTIGLDKGVLGEIFGNSTIPHHPVEVIQDRRLVALEKSLERCWVPRSGSPDEIPVIHHAAAPTPLDRTRSGPCVQVRQAGSKSIHIDRSNEPSGDSVSRPAQVASLTRRCCHHQCRVPNPEGFATAFL